jgi:hypothetical protein
MLVLSAAYWLPASTDVLWQPQHPYFMSGAVSRMLSVFIYILAALLLSRQTFFDRAVKWKGALYLWFVALSTFANGNATVAFAALLFLLSFVVLLFTQYATNTVGLLYTSFMLLGVLSFIVPHSLYFLPLYLLFCSMTNTLSVRGVAASLLGLLTPFWLVMGTAYVLPGVNVITESFMAALPAIFDVEFPSFSLPNMLLLIFELSVLLPAMFLFVGGTSPAKPLLRRRLSFITVAAVYLLLLCTIVSVGAQFFYACQLPFVAILASYVLARKETKLLNIYFVIFNVLMIAIATSPLWLNS